jgi:hypothetical protein
MAGITIGDEVYSHPRRLFAKVVETFPAAVCVKLGILSLREREPLELLFHPQLWRADDIENLSVCRHCGRRDDLQEQGSGVPYRVCAACSHPGGEPSSLRADPSSDAQSLP